MATILDPYFTTTVPARAQSVPLVWERMRGWFGELGIDADALHDWRLVVSELTANACEAAPAKGTVTVEARCDNERCELTVRNPVSTGAEAFRARDPGSTASRGRGLYIVDQIVDGLDITIDDGWVEVLCWRSNGAT